MLSNEHNVRAGIRLALHNGTIADLEAHSLLIGDLARRAAFCDGYEAASMQRLILQETVEFDTRQEAKEQGFDDELIVIEDEDEDEPSRAAQEGGL